MNLHAPADHADPTDTTGLGDGVLAALAPRAPWMEDAACIGRTTLFFGSSFERPERRQRRETRAAAVCARCPVVEPCRDQARRKGESGFWGGESEEDRAAAGYPPVSISRRSVQAAAIQGRRSLPDSRAS